jgi:hypothetical protein
MSPEELFMRFLLVHPEDSVLSVPWSSLHWDLVIDLGWAGYSQYSDWSAKIGCPVRSVWDFANWHEDVRRIQELCGIGNDRLVDAEGIDWWELLAPSSYQQVYEFLLLQKLAREIEIPTEVCVTRPHHLADALGKLLGVKVDPFVAQSERSASARFSRFITKLRTLTSAQIVQIAFDKWDGDYGVRRYFSRRRQSSGSGKVLLPSAYRNVSRVLTRYAGLLPDRRFLLVTTRVDDAAKDLPPHVGAMSLAAYAPWPRPKTTEREIATLKPQWRMIKRKLYEAHPSLPLTLGLFDSFDHRLRNGLRVRDAWRGVFEREEIGSVLCADENNLYTRLPVLLARRRGVPTVYCSHGALDAYILLRGVCSETYLAKGEMERDYLVKECGVPRERIVVGAPPGSHFTAQGEGAGTHIVFFSEPYELYYGRTETLYRELLPRLCAIAREHGRKVMVKLHPFESLTARLQIVERVLTNNDRKLVEVIADPVSEGLLRKIWFSLTVESSVAVECALAGVPSFLCGWFDIDLYSYGKQYERFGAARILDDPADISRIPELLGSQRPGAEVRNRLYTPITREDLEAVLQGKATARISGISLPADDENGA